MLIVKLKKGRRNIIKKILLIVLLIIAITELSLRYFWGFGNPILYVYSEDYEYIYAPNQDITRLGSRIITNEFSMRNGEINTKAKKRILGLGDSVLNGGTLTSHDSLASTQLADKLSVSLGEDVEVLNVAAGSWGPDNALAYVEKNGNFNADCILLVISSHDLYDVMTHENIVGKLKSYPDKEPLTAIGEVISRYVFGDNISTANSVVNKSAQINPGIMGLVNYCRENGKELLVYLHPEISELRAGEYSKNGKELLEMFRNNQVEVIQGINYEEETCFRDIIHLNDHGQRIMADALFPKLESILRKIE